MVGPSDNSLVAFNAGVYLKAGRRRKSPPVTVILLAVLEFSYAHTLSESQYGQLFTRFSRLL